MRRKVVIPYTLTKGESTITIDDISKGIVPSRAVVGMVSGKSFDSNAKDNPFYFDNYGVSSIQLYVNDQPIRPAYTSSIIAPPKRHIYYDAFTELAEGSPQGLNLNPREFNYGYTLWSWNPTLANNSAQREGRLRLEIRFGTPLVETVKLIFYMVYEDTLYLS